MDCSQITLNRIYEETGINYEYLFMANWANISMHQTLSEEFMRDEIIKKFQKNSKKNLILKLEVIAGCIKILNLRKMK